MSERENEPGGPHYGGGRGGESAGSEGGQADAAVAPAGMEERATLTQARSMLILLLATCRQTEVALEAAANALDTDLTGDLATMIERTEAELAALVEKIEALPD